MKFRKPPVVEVWISVDFDPNEKKREPLDAQRVEDYRQRVRSEFPKRESLHATTFTFEEKSATELLRVTDKDVRLKSVCLWNHDRSRLIQIDDDQFAFHVLKTPAETPSFSRVRAAAQPNPEKYVQVFLPQQIRHATLHYLDIVEIPRPAGG